MSEFWIGGYGPDMKGTGTGIVRADSAQDGSLRIGGVVADIASPSFLLQHDDRVWAAAEGAGTVQCFALDGTHISTTPSGGTWPCHLAAAADAIVVANYFDGTLGVIAAGVLEQVLHGSPGSGAREQQNGPHAHSGLQLDERHYVSVDLGADELVVHRLLGDSIERTDALRLPPGTGPRDIARHASGLLYVVSEFSGELIVVQWRDARLEVVASTPLPGHAEGDAASAIAFHGEFVYVGVRGANRIAVLRASADGRSVLPVGSVSCAGDWPRHLVVHDSVLHVANQLSNTIASFRMDEGGLPQLIGEPVAVPSPTYILPIGAPISSEPSLW